jgi:hypothetical protein
MGIRPAPIAPDGLEGKRLYQGQTHADVLQYPVNPNLLPDIYRHAIGSVRGHRYRQLAGFRYGPAKKPGDALTNVSQGGPLIRNI